MSFIGMESLNEQSLRSVNKKQNKVEEYKIFFHKLKGNGILSFVGLMFALEEDTAEYYEKLPKLLDEIEVDVILPSIAIPIFGTPLYNNVKNENRIIDYDISHYEGDHVVFKHKHLSSDEIYSAYKRINAIFYSPGKILKRWFRIIGNQTVQESIPQFILKLLVITFVYFKLSVFQRHHAMKRVFVNKSSNVIVEDKSASIEVIHTI